MTCERMKKSRKQPPTELFRFEFNESIVTDRHRTECSAQRTHLLLSSHLSAFRKRNIYCARTRIVYTTCECLANRIQIILSLMVRRYVCFASFNCKICIKLRLRHKRSALAMICLNYICYFWSCSL